MTRSAKLISRLAVGLATLAIVVGFVFSHYFQREPIKFQTSGFALNANFLDPYALTTGYQQRTLALPSLLKSSATVRGKAVFQPVTVARRGVDFLEIYAKTKEQKYLDEATGLMAQLVEHSSLDGSQSRWLTYTFDFKLHNDSQNVIHAPWYSAMAQGLALSFSTRLYQATQDDKYLKDADGFYNSLAYIWRVLDLRSQSLFVSYVDVRDYLWLEEYAGDVTPMQVINGHNFAIFGLADYWKVTKSARAGQMIDGAATTIDHYFSAFRNPGGVSWYGLRIQNTPRALSKHYHVIVTEQLKILASITGDPRFTQESNLLKRDFYQVGI